MDGWSIKVWPQTVATRLGFQSGPSHDENDCWGGWIKNKSPDETRVPEQQQWRNELYFQINNPEHLQAEVTILYDGMVKKHFSFDGPNDNDTVEVSDTDSIPELLIKYLAAH